MSARVTRHTRKLRQLNMGAGFTADDGSSPYKDLHGEDVPEDLKILSLDDALAYLTSAGDYSFIIEVKDPGEVGMKCVDILYQTLQKYDIVDKVAFGSFNGEVSDYKDEAYPDLMLRSTCFGGFGFLCGCFA